MLAAAHDPHCSITLPGGFIMGDKLQSAPDFRPRLCFELPLFFSSFSLFFFPNSLAARLIFKMC
jgi:hypothetical protein